MSVFNLLWQTQSNNAVPHGSDVGNLPLESTVKQVKADIAEISDEVKSLGNAISSFPDSGGTLLQALAIHNSAQKLISTINHGTTDINGTSTPSEDDSKDVLDAFHELAPSISSALEALVNKKAAFESLPFGQWVSGLVKQDLGQLADATKQFASGLVSKAPDDLESQAQLIADGISSDIATAQTAYA
ncbi:hypothetical protein V5O48_011783 [Marasmius crinis-equi]|uniref:Hydrophobic surface binding protein n=1 Tax=Marasmius crinis-equi TaxID=585013 RepID=A0ABR3F547_9AGAR